MLTDGQAVLLHAEIGPPARFDAIGQRCVQLPLQIALIVFQRVKLAHQLGLDHAQKSLGLP